MGYEESCYKYRIKSQSLLISLGGSICSHNHVIECVHAVDGNEFVVVLLTCY